MVIVVDFLRLNLYITRMLGSTIQEVHRRSWILIPVCDDWAALDLLLAVIDALEAPRHFDVLVVNDSPLPPPLACITHPVHGRIRSVRILNLKRNVGHQRAITLGLCHWLTQDYAGSVVVMDADGEDKPEDILRLLDAAEKYNGDAVVFAARAKRSENTVFRLGYYLYRWVHYCLTGIPVRFGNFSALHRQQIRTLVNYSEMWNHYAASVIRSRIPYTSIPTHRGRRLAGKSRMNLAGWVGHGISALSIFSDLVGTRILIASVAGFTCMTSFAVLLILCDYWLQWTFAPVIEAFLVFFALLFLSASMAASFFLFAVMNNRAMASFIPIRDCLYLLESVTTLDFENKPSSTSER